MTKIPKPKLIKKPRKWLRKRRKRSPKAILFDRVWDKCSEFVRRRDNGKCFTCGEIKRWQDQQAGHFRHGKEKETYFDDRQIKCQCTKCNHFLSGNLGIFGVKLVKELGQKEIDEIILLSYPVHYWKVKELETLDEYFTNKLKIKLC